MSLQFLNNGYKNLSNEMKPVKSVTYNVDYATFKSMQQAKKVKA